MRLDTRAFAIAGGVVGSGAVFGLTLLYLVGPGDAGSLTVLSSFLFGYSGTLAGAFVGALWAYLYGWLLAGAFAFAYNLALVPPPPVEEA